MFTKSFKNFNNLLKILPPLFKKFYQNFLKIQSKIVQFYQNSKNFIELVVLKYIQILPKFLLKFVENLIEIC